MLSGHGLAPLTRLVPCQATFLRGSTASDLPDNPELRAQLEALSPEELEMRCRRSGLSRRGTAADQVHLPVALLEACFADAASGLEECFVGCTWQSAQRVTRSRCPACCNCMCCAIAR